MCGIAGYFDSTKAIDRATLETMTRCIAHRGPDADGFFTDGPAGLGHRRLSIIDLSAAANQPMLSHDGRYAIAFNGEVYNYQEVANAMKLSRGGQRDEAGTAHAFRYRSIA
jgi:asparagine synthase (glutamine-hydrolysing)